MSKESFDKVFAQPPKDYYPPRELHQALVEIARLNEVIADYERHAGTESRAEEYQTAWHKGYYAGYCDADSGFDPRMSEEKFDAIRQD